MRHSYRPAIPPPPQPYRTQVLDHLGLVAGMFEELGITEGKAASSPCLRSGSTLALRGRGFHPALDQGDAHAPLEPQHKVPRPNGQGLNG